MLFGTRSEVLTSNSVDNYDGKGYNEVMKITCKTHPKIYQDAHKWVWKNFGKASRCSKDINHVSKKYEWANISGEYLHDIKDWMQLCPSCHRKMDFTEEIRKKLSLGSMGQISTRRRKIVKIDPSTNKRLAKYSYIELASRETGISRTAIINCLQKRTETSGGFAWKYI